MARFDPAEQRLLDTPELKAFGEATVARLPDGMRVGMTAQENGIITVFVWNETGRELGHAGFASVEGALRWLEAWKPPKE